MPEITGGRAFRIWTGDYVCLQAVAFQNGIWVGGKVRIENDDGTRTSLTFPSTALAGGLSTLIVSSTPSPKNGWVVSVNAYNYLGTATGSPPLWCDVFLSSSQVPTDVDVAGHIASGYVGSSKYLMLGNYDALDFKSTYVFQGTVAEDATAGTHDVRLTLTPGLGGEMEILYGAIIVGNTVTGQKAQAWITDGVNVVGYILNSNGNSATTAGLVNSFPTVDTTSQIGTTTEDQASSFPTRVSGAMQLVLRVQTTAVSVTQTFSVVCRFKGFDPPEGVLSDTVGAPTLTTNTDAIF